MSWRSKGVPLVIFAIFIFQISAPMVSFPTEELSSNDALEAQSIGFTSGSGHDLEGDSITVDGKSWTVRGESILDYWETNVHSEISDGLVDMLVTEEGVGHSCSINGTSISMHTIHLDGSFDTLLIETLPNGSTVSDCAIGITNQDRIQIVYNVGDDLRLARLAEINAVYQQRTWHLRTIVEDSFNSGLTISLDSESHTNIIYQDLDMALHHVWFNKAYWNHTILDDGPIGNDIEVVIDSDDMVHVVYTNSAEGEVRLIKFNETMETRQILTRGSTVGSAIGMDLDSNGIEQITYSKSDGLGNNTISLLRSLAGKDTGRIDPDAKWIITYDDDSVEGIVTSGDLNGDGKDDLIYSDPDGNGTISIHYGTPDGPGDLADRILVGSLSDSMLGTALAIGDFNCDGLDDIASSEPGLGINNSGYISIRLGANSGISTNVWWEMNGSDDDNLGMSITSLGDVESDGCDDLAVVSDKMIEENVAQPTLSKNGMVTIYSGNQTAMIHHANITQTEAGTMFGRQIIGNGDINGDGYSDMVISNTGDKLSPTGYSSVEFFLGDITGMSTTPSDTHSVSTQGRLYGFEMAFVGDVHGDGYDDVLISELFASTTLYQSGKVHMWDGSMNGPIANWTTTGGYANALLGQTISAAGDINEDGFDDFLMMAPSSSKSGKVDLYLGSATGPRIDTQLFAQGATNEYVGLNILAGIDLNGDGMDEILYSSRDLTRGENFGPVLTIMSERDWEFIDFDFDQSVIGIDMSTPLRGSPCIMAMLSDSSLILLENTPDGTPSGRWVSRGLANADVAKMGISNAGKPLILYHSSSNLMTLSLTGNTAIESQLNAGTGLGMMMNSAIDSNGNQRLGHASTTYSSIFYTEETGTDFLTTTVRTNIDLLHPIGMHVDSNDLSRMVYVDDDDHMVRLATLNGTWDEVSILNTTIGDDFDTIWDGDDTLIFAQIAVSNNSTMLQIVEYKNNTTTITDLVHANLSSSFEITELDDLLIVSIMDSDKLTVFERLASGGNWSIAKELWLLGETEGHNLAIHGQLILFDANDTVQGLLIEDGAGSWVHYSMDIPDTNSSYDVFTTGSRWHATSTNELNQLVWTSGTINNTSIMHTPVVSTTFPAIITNSPVPLDMGEDGKLMFAYSQSSTNDFYAMRFVSDQDRDLVPDSHDDKPQLGNQWADSDFDGFGDNPLGPSPDACPSEIGYSIYDRNGCDDYDADGWSDLIDDCVNDDGTSWWGRYGCDDLDQDGWIDDGVYGDRYPTNWKQALDSDRDSFGDNHGPDCCDVTVLGELETNTPDVFPYNRKQWEDVDNDGYGDNESDLEFGDKCWWVQGFSWVDRLGCVDTDGDGVSDPSEIGTSREWNVDDGADLWPEDGTQWADSDGDGYGDNSSDNATLPDKYPTNPSAANDTDGDGYPNNWTALENGTNRAGLSLDNCPDKAGTSTSSVNNLGAVVPYYGCTDTDNDGREDSTDAFPEDPTQIADSDGDGWGDSLSGTDPDYCPYEFGVINGTNGIGCPIVGQAEDSDQDGVADEFDDCANTQIGEEVDTIGCSANQKDGDQDFVSDAEDMCPDTPIGETVDSIGCSDSQKEVDSDEDGVFDPFDLCPGSNPELTIDDDGCNLAQKDTDGDGVNDLMDMCPGTELGIPVLPSNGCLDEAALAEDIDGDGYKGPYSYNPDNETHQGDAFPLDSTQWHDMDGDGYGDSQISGANNSDDCPEEWGNSSMKSRLGCLDSDGDGYHDYLGDDKFPADGTQWEDADLDNWGDNPDGNDPDQCLNTGYAGDSTAQARINFGCSDKQFDSDNDGVNDFWDICPNTNVGADVYAKESTSPGCPVPIEETDDTGTDLIMGMEPLIFFGAIGGGGLIFVILLVFIISKSRGGDDFNFDDDWNDDEDEDDDDDDDFMSSVLGNSQSRGPSAAPARGPGRGPPSAGRGPAGPGGPSQGPGARGPGGPSRGPSQGPGARGPGGPSRGPSQGPGARGPGGPNSSPDPRGPARGKKVAKRKPISDDGKVRKAKVTIDPDLFTQQELGDRVAAVDWTKGALQDGESERTILMQLQTTGWSAPQSRAIIELSKK